MLVRADVLSQQLCMYGTSRPHQQLLLVVTESVGVTCSAQTHSIDIKIEG